MKQITTFLAAALVAALMTACGSDKTGDTVTKAATDGVDKVTTAASGAIDAARNQFVDGIKVKVSDIEDKLTGFDGKLSGMNPMAKKAAEKPLQVAHEKVGAVKDQITQLADAPADKWSKHKPAVEKAMTELQDSFSKVSGLF